INTYLDQQIKTLESADEADKNLIEALKSAKLDMSSFHKDAITAKSPIETTAIRTKIQDEINKKTAQAINAFMKYMNDGKEADDVKALKKADIKNATKDMVNLIKQWDGLPHIKDATDAMKITGINNVNKEWLESLQSLIDSMESDNGGDTDGDKATKDNNTNPELATSVLGRMGSSLFTVRRAEHADDDPNKPLTNTLAWDVEEEERKSDKYDPGPAAKDDFLAMFAATAMYTPFISRIGDKDYLEAYKALFGEGIDEIKDDDKLVRFDGNALGPIDVLNQVQNLKKPLYYFTDLDALGKDTVYGHSTEDVKGVASLLTVGDLIKVIKEKGDLAAITLNGVMEKDGDSWAFYNYSLNIDGQVESKAPDGEEGDKAQKDANTVVAGHPIVNKVHADKTVNGGQENTRVIFEMSFNDKNPGAALVTAALMHNIYNDTVLKSKFKERSDEAVYVDAIGNIVLNDGLIVLPAAANPTYWAIPNSLTGSEYETETWTYNPFTVAFMDTYPAIYQGGTAPSSVNQKKDKNKYIFTSFTTFTSGFIVTPLKKGFKNTFTESRSAGLYKKFKFVGDAAPQDDIVKALDYSIGVDDKETAADTSWWKVGSANPLQMKNLVTPTGDSIFPYLTTQVTDPDGQKSFSTDFTNYRSAIIIAKNMYAYILGEVENNEPGVTAADGVSLGGSSDGLLREGFLFNNVTMPVLTGVTNGVEFDKTNAKSDLLKAGGDANVVEKWILNFSKWLSTASKDAKNILAIANPDDVSLLKLLYGFLIDYGYYIIFILLIMLVIIFLREGDFMAAALKGFMIIALLFTSLFLIPLSVPWATGVTSAPLTKGTVLNSLMTKLEMSEKVHSVEPAGQSGLSVKLYNLSPKQAKEINEQHMYDKGNYLTNKFSINDNLGMFVEGTELRLDLYSFWRFDPLIIATAGNVTDPNFTEETHKNIPQIYHADHSTSKMMVDNKTAKDEMAYNNDLVDYYMPFNLLENGFMKTLNTYLIYYNPPQSVVRYPDGLVKSSYIMNTYMKSLAFLAGEPNIAKLISSAKTAEEYKHRGLNEQEVSLVNEKFYPYGDILNLQPWVETEWNDLPQNYANAVWTQAMLDAGYYTPGSGIEKRVALANRVNRKAYDMIMQMKDTKGLVSDESMVKLVALYATFEWNKEISYINHNVFPRTASLNEVSAADIISATVLGQSKQFMFYDTSVISNVYMSNGLLGVAAVDLALIALALYSIFLSWILPIMILGLVVYSVYLILTNRRMMPAIIFTFKLTVLAILMNLLLVTVISLYQMYDNIYLLTLGLVVVDAVFGWLFWRLLFKRKSKLASSWQNKHLNQMRGDGTNYMQDNVGRAPLNMQEYLREQDGVNAGRGAYSNRGD
ncbi:hypothetical protein, partial [Lysinibacillus xylanilyticus]|uniref:hypothetical protein n=1 Tax=Lysinibacillus xylanilyticus TaxID=582475 RepID=UPI0036DDFBDE